MNTASPIAVVTLKSLAESGLPSAVYDVVKNKSGPSTAAKNAIIEATRVAMKGPKVQATRDAAIKVAVASNGKFQFFASDIIAAVNAADPIAPLYELKSLKDSGLRAEIYNIIINSGDSVVGKNAVIDAVRAAIMAAPQIQATRDAAIHSAVEKNSGLIYYQDLAAEIIKAVNAVEPLAP